MKNYSLPASFAICTAAYILAFVAWYFINPLLVNINPLLATLIEDVIATFIIFAFSLYFRNASMYDPYWSVIPVYIVLQWSSSAGANPVIAGPVTVVVLLGAIRLTLNWARGWKGLSHEDWRYIMLREKNPSIYWLTNLGGIHLFPTAMVFMGMIPVYFAIEYGGGHFLAPVFYAGLCICVLATLIELVADEQLRSFKKSAKQGAFIKTGIWKYSRHPNYFGEISFWLGLWIIQMSVAPQYWYTAIGFIAMFIMFRFASIPMMEEKNLKSKPGYEDYVKRVSMLIPWRVG